VKPIFSLNGKPQATATCEHSHRSREGLVLAKSCAATPDRVFIDTAFPVTPFLLWTALALDTDDEGLSAAASAPPPMIIVLPPP
jgi:hypothetical protein